MLKLQGTHFQIRVTMWLHCIIISI